MTTRHFVKYLAEECVHVSSLSPSNPQNEVEWEWDCDMTDGQIRRLGIPYVFGLVDGDPHGIYCFENDHYSETIGVTSFRQF